MTEHLSLAFKSDFQGWIVFFVVSAKCGFDPNASKVPMWLFLLILSYSKTQLTKR